MRATIIVGVLALLAAAALATETEVEAEVEAKAEVEAESAVPILPGLGTGCLEQRGAPWWKRKLTPWLYSNSVDDNNEWVNEMREEDERPRRYRRRTPKVFNGRCTYDRDCPSNRAVYGECAGMGVVCCSHKPVVVPGKKPARPANLQSSGCAAIGGKCVKDSTCTGTSKITRGLCPGDKTIICCSGGSGGPVVTPPTPGGVPLHSLVPIPAGINRGLSIPSPSFQTSLLGTPGCPLTSACFSCGCANSERIKSKLFSMQVTPNMKITGLKPFVEALARGLENAKKAGGDALAAYNAVRSAGGHCCRAIKKSNGQPGSGHSNHSWGAAVDIYFGTAVDPRGDGKTQIGLKFLAPFFAAEKLYWAAGYGGSGEDAMHFEASVEVLREWRAAGKI